MQLSSTESRQAVFSLLLAIPIAALVLIGTLGMAALAV
jgi:hypothetical protein